MRRGDHHHWQWQRMAQAWRLLAALFAAAPVSLLVVGCPAADCPGPDCLAADCFVAGHRAAAPFRRLPASAWRPAAEIAMPGRAASRPESIAATAWNRAAAFAAAPAPRTDCPRPHPAAAAGSEPQSRLRKYPLRLRPIQYEHYPEIGAIRARCPNRDGNMKVRARPRY